MKLTPTDRISLVNAIAAREGTARQLAERYGTTLAVLRKFVEVHRAEIEEAQQELETNQKDEVSPGTVTPKELDQLWITKKNERLTRYQYLADELYRDALSGGLSGADLATTVREFRSYLMLAANELGQLLHRGSGEAGTGESLSVDIQGVDLDSLK